MECSGGYSSPRNESFPAGLRVLVVDDDPTWLKILEKMLKKCSYEVITCGLAREALDLLRERKDGFDIVISDVNMPDMDGFKLLEHVGLEMDLPVIMMSVDGETSRVMKGVQHGACDYLLKPIRMKELRNIWQHVLRKRIHEVRDIEGHEGLEEIHLLRNGYEHHLEDGYFPYANDMSRGTLGKKRKEFDNKHDGREYNNDPSSSKKIRVVWTVDLHQKFVKAVNHIGFEKVGPKKILDLMGVPWLTRENVASHLQKYRLYLSRLQKEKDRTATFSGMNISPKEQNGNHCPQIRIANQQQKDLSNVNHNTMHHELESKIQEEDDDMKSYSVTKPLFDQEPYKASNEKLICWDAEIGQFQQEEDFRQQFEHRGFNLLSIPTVSSSIKSKPSGVSRDIEGEDRVKSSLNVNSGSHGFGQILQFKISKNDSQITDEALKLQQPNILWSIKNQTLEHIPLTHEDPSQQMVNQASLTGFGFWDESPKECLLQTDFHDNIEFLDYTNPDQIISEFAGYSYDSLKYDHEYPLDQIEYSVVNHGLFIV